MGKPSRTRSDYLIIPDVQIPFEHPRSLTFLKEVKKEFSIPDENILCVGDELDEYWGGMYRKDPMASHTAMQEIEESREKLKAFIAAFPNLRICFSNHGTRWQRKAFEAEIPSIMMRQYQEVMEIPPTWRYADHWLIKAKYPFLVEHGDKHGGTFPHVQASRINGISTAIGHFHSVLGVEYTNTTMGSIWGMCVASLIDAEAYAFKYSLKHSKRPVLGCGVILDEGRTALPVPLVI